MKTPSLYRIQHPHGNRKSIHAAIALSYGLNGCRPLPWQSRQSQSSSATRLSAEVHARRTSPRSSRPPTISAGAKCTCSEAVRSPDAQREELCEIRLSRSDQVARRSNATEPRSGRKRPRKVARGCAVSNCYCSLTVTL